MNRLAAGETCSSSGRAMPRCTDWGGSSGSTATPEDFLAAIDAQEEAQFGDESFTDQEIGQAGCRVLAVTACVNGIAHTYMAAEALNKAGAKMGVTIKVETNGSDGAKNILTKDEIANCDGIIVAAEKKIETARFDGKPVLFTRV